MLVGVYIIVDDDYESPIHADPPTAELDDGLWNATCEIVQDVFDEEREPRGSVGVGEHLVAWRGLVKAGITFVAITRHVKPTQTEAYLNQLARRYADEVDDLRAPDRAGVEDIVIDVIPPWEEDDT